MSKTIKENNNTGSLCILLWHFILLVMECSMVFRRTKYRTLTQVKAILIHKIISGPLHLFSSYCDVCIRQHLQELSSNNSDLLESLMPA